MSTIKHQIKHINGSVLFEADIPADTPSGLATRAALEKAVSAGAYLDGANLDGANLDGANLDGAYLDGANLDGANLVGKRPILQIAPLGSRCAYLVSYITAAGIKVRAGCFFGTLEEFEAACAKTHGDNEHGKEYAAAVVMIRAHAALWMPEVTA